MDSTLSLGIHQAQICLVPGRDPRAPSTSLRSRPPAGWRRRLQGTDRSQLAASPGSAWLPPSPFYLSLFSLCVMFRGVFIVVPGRTISRPIWNLRRDSTLVESWPCLVFLPLQKRFSKSPEQAGDPPRPPPGPQWQLCSARRSMRRGGAGPWPGGAAIPHHAEGALALGSLEKRAVVPAPTGAGGRQRMFWRVWECPALRASSSPKPPTPRKNEQQM